MPKIDLTPELQTRLLEAAAAQGRTPAELIASWLASPAQALQTNPLVAYTQGAEFRAKSSDAERYLALLARVAQERGAEFTDFIAHHANGRKYLGLSPEEIRETCRHNQARPIEGTPYWAIMNLDTATKRRFLRRLLVFVGESDEVISHLTATINGR